VYLPARMGAETGSGRIDAYGSPVRAMFVVYLAGAVSGITYFVIIGLSHH
jgi:hypothetical protein